MINDFWLLLNLRLWHNALQISSYFLIDFNFDYPRTRLIIDLMILMNSPEVNPISKILILSWLTLVLSTSRAHTMLVFLLLDIDINYTKHMGNKGIERTDEWILRSESLMTKIHMGQQKQVIDHFDSQKIDIKTPLNQTGDTLAHYAAYKGHYKILEYLRQKGDNFDTLNTRNLSPIDVALPAVRQKLFGYRNR